MNKKKLGKTILTGGIAFLAFAVSLGTAYFVTPSKTITENFDYIPDNNQVANDNALPDHFMQFVTVFARDTGLNEDEEENTRERDYYGLHASFDQFAISFRKDETSSLNKIAINGDLDFLMRGLKDINFNLDLDVDYNNHALPLELGYTNKTFYFGLKDLRLKVSSTSIDELLGNPTNGEFGLLYQLFMASKEEGGINFDIEEFIGEKINALSDSLIGGLDLSNLASSFALGGLKEGENGIGVKVEETEKDDGYDFKVNLEIRKENTETNEIDDKVIEAIISTNKEYRLTKVDLTNVNFGNVSISGAINIDCIKNHTVLSADDENYPRYNSAYQYVEVINYKGWLQKLANFLDEDNQKFGVDFALSLSGENTEIGEINGSINADFSKIIDISNYQYVQTSNGLQKRNKINLGEKIKNSATFGLTVNMLGKEKEEYGNLAIKYVDGAGYINLNQSLDSENNLTSVLKAKVETETMNWLFDKLPAMVKEVSDEDNATSAVTSLFSFISDSALVKGIKDGDYSVVIDLLKDIKNSGDGIEIALDLSTLGLGENASVNLLLDAQTGENNKILNLDLNNLEIGSLKLDASINSNGYQDVLLGEEESYDSLSFLPTVFDQVSGILETKQAGFALDGSLLDEHNLGIKLQGEGQFDYGEKFGFGNLTIDQYKYENKGVWYSHKINLDVDNTNGDYALNNVFFSYGDLSSDNIKGKLTVQSLLDIVDVIKTFINDNKDNKKFTKFIAPIMKSLSLSKLSDVIAQKDYLRFVKNDLLKSVRRNGDNISIIIGGALFGMDQDITINILLKDDALDALEIKDVKIKEKTLNLKISLKDYDENKTSNLNSSDAYMDLSSIAVLLKFGINTTKNNYYHLSANISLNALAIINASFEMDVDILVDDEHVKIYGIIPDAKLVNIIGSAIQDYNLFAQSVKSEFTFETYDDNDVNKEDGVGGYFHFKTTEVRAISGRTFIRHYKTTSKNLLESNNIMTYLLNDMLLIKSSITDKIGDISLGNDEEKEAGNFANLFTDTGFTFNESKNRWNIGIYLNEITGIDALRDLELTINGNAEETLSSISAKLNIKASLVTISIGADITLDKASLDTSSWTSNVESAFSAINNINFPESKLNNPTDYYNN